ncbi:hypothetical protein NED98_01175 [Sphingomonas sp. MMSM20]|nr:hypothetical protein [Sphingomonas lycopersici]
MPYSVTRPAGAIPLVEKPAVSMISVLVLAGSAPVIAISAVKVIVELRSPSAFASRIAWRNSASVPAG